MTKEEQKFIKLMKRATNLIIKARTIKGGRNYGPLFNDGFYKSL